MEIIGEVVMLARIGATARAYDCSSSRAKV